MVEAQTPWVGDGLYVRRPWERASIARVSLFARSCTLRAFRGFNPSRGPRCAEIFVSFLSLLLGLLDESVSVSRKYRLVDNRSTATPSLVTEAWGKPWGLDHGGSTNTMGWRWVVRQETMRESFYHQSVTVCPPRGGGVFLSSHNKIHDTHTLNFLEIEKPHQVFVLVQQIATNVSSSGIYFYIYVGCELLFSFCTSRDRPGKSPKTTRLQFYFDFNWIKKGESRGGKASRDFYHTGRILFYNR